MGRSKRSAIGCGVMMSAIAQAVLAQTAPAPTTLEPVTITANKREERLQDVPATATVVQSQQLDQQNIHTIQDLTRAVPTFDANIPGLGMSIRGFGGSSFSLTAESSVGILVDGVSLSGAGDYPPDLFDVERVEVIEGPQGTLFGKNTSAGIINIVTRAPNTSRFGGMARVDEQNRGGKSAQAAINVPVSDALAFRVSATMRDDPRSTHDLFDDSWDSPRKTSARLRMLWKATNDIAVNLSADQTETRLHGGGLWSVYKSTTGSLLTTVSNACGVTIRPDNTDVCSNPSQNGNFARVGGYSAQVDWTLGNYVLTSVSAVRDVKNDIAAADYDMIGLRAPNYFQPEVKTYHNVSQEFRIASPDYGWGNFVAGAYYFKGQITQDISNILTLPAFTLGSRNLVGGENLSNAVFGQATYKFNKALSMNAGARVGHEKASTDRTGTLAPGAVAATHSAFRRHVGQLRVVAHRCPVRLRFQPHGLRDLFPRLQGTGGQSQRDESKGSSSGPAGDSPHAGSRPEESVSGRPRRAQRLRVRHEDQKLPGKRLGSDDTGVRVFQRAGAYGPRRDAQLLRQAHQGADDQRWRGLHAIEAGARLSGAMRPGFCRWLHTRCNR
jgi:iron complex outermembrane recepter protein